jgi:single-strand DNA-binding protein
MNIVILVGNLTRDPEVRYAANGNPVAHISVAVSRSFSRDGGPEADFFRVTVFGKQAELVERYLRKGRKVGIEGRIQNDNYEKDGQKIYRDTIIANRIEFLSPKSEGGGASDWPADDGGLFDAPQAAPGGSFQVAPGSRPAGKGAPAGPIASEPTSATEAGFSSLDDDDDDLPF